MSHSSHADPAHGTLGSYVVGLVACFILTAASFATVAISAIPAGLRLPLLVLLCVVQLVLQLRVFLHLGTAKRQRDNTGIFLCTGFLIVIVVAGSLWVMHNANLNMMPMDMSTPAAVH
ncbi:cytochrome o ubiquinol oxidase subunit IV [Pseudoxanthomonas sp.]|uniref:cytochrome o ubiquinol oxidase subunit IV n=1 Tax=Pseudoxanthomonas sp. TaxID=1871049 RepID=UPI0026264C6E|nr:cytochrome o ubiquinol oxidase subunit IV [Pseudoxanthomonas sp.]WDS34849.1 MAG: cytochrome o ubiquinol oxidase subunit IV [Pseudoxanthomonas sp.]